MPSFDVVSEVDGHEVQNAVQQSQKMVQQRFDLKDYAIEIIFDDKQIILQSKESFGVEQTRTILFERLSKRGIDLKALDAQPPESTTAKTKQVLKLKQGIDSAQAKKITAVIRDSKLKVQANIQADQVRVVGKKRDDLQAVMQLLKGHAFDQPLQFSNFRD